MSAPIRATDTLHARATPRVPSITAVPPTPDASPAPAIMRLAAVSETAAGEARPAKPSTAPVSPGASGGEAGGTSSAAVGRGGSQAGPSSFAARARRRHEKLWGEVEGEQIKVYATTWNLHGLPTPGMETLATFLPASSIDADVYVVGTQECEQSISKAFFVSSKKAWETALGHVLGPQYVLLRSHTLMAIHIAVYVRASLLEAVTHLRSDAVATGIANLVGNKGGVAVSVHVAGVAMLFVCAHLPAHQGAVSERNEAYHRINANLAVVPPRLVAPESADLFDAFDVVIWFGDLNYRVNGTRALVDAALARNELDVLLGNDQLRIEAEAGRAFVGLAEAPIAFGPTYKFDAGTSSYDSSAKARIPSWTDRILYKPSPCCRLHAYADRANVLYSDHKPVFATLVVDADKTEAGTATSLPPQTVLGMSEHDVDDMMPDDDAGGGDGCVVS
ncbi:inositol polyphosphate 5-phosphatase [Thecamonas trahens ATCC 50062]|uniref:Inositol polyphosphate 5-phosphatase n=1 Tax=Thecamonas trahens ATCC 50062 TaxID=461836 RepID=A0A0L0DCU9_THETB|nr:inositol polyphosphate 5-phosphatase [Thecamonas trahens ATCC 50062]KNC50149.1 inositol polyphosphate 5-phosphatase [Thecamonas trahens ATCC 50062]|eukprot:XP_013756995.1 inositol polyphosphate 5-phosphatase [Thecamonas trahens ATCC 50062]